MRFTRKLNSFEGVAAGQTATLRLPVGLTYHQLLITYGGATLAQINKITIVANGKPIQTFRDATELDAFNQFDKRAGAAGDTTLVIDFERYGLLQRLGREHTALGTGAKQSAENPNPITTLEVQVEIDAAAVSPTLSGKAIQSSASNTGIIKKVRTFSYDPAGAGDFEIADLPKVGIINRIHFKSANINKLTVESDGYVMFERTKAENDRVQSDGVRAPVAGYFVLDTTEEGYTGEGLATHYKDGRQVSDLRFRLDMAAADNVLVSVEYLDELGN